MQGHQKLPSFLLLEITTECNFKCKQCHQWMTKETTNAIPTSEKLRAVEELAQLSPAAKIILTGGETMLKNDEFFAICKHAKKYNLKVIANTNGSFINEQNMLDVLKYGPDYLIISLDSHIEKLHRFTRGNKESFNHIVNIIPKLIDLRNLHNLDTQIYTHSIIFEENIRLWADYIEFARTKLKVDAVYFQLLKETLRNQNSSDPFFEKHFFKDLNETLSIFNEIIKIYKDDSFMGTKAFDIELMKSEVFNPRELKLGICQSASKNIVIDSYGWVQLCMNMYEIMPKDFIGNYKNLTLTEVWDSTKANNAREIMKNCTKNCGMLNCHREVSYEKRNHAVYN